VFLGEAMGRLMPINLLPKFLHFLKERIPLSSEDEKPT